MVIATNEFPPQGLAAVVVETGWAFIDTRGTLIVPPFVLDNGPD